MTNAFDEYFNLNQKKSSTLKEYRKRGGMVGYANTLLIEEAHKAILDTSHPMHAAIKAIRNGELETGGHLLASVLLSYNEDSPLSILGLVFVRMPAQLLAIKNAENHLMSGNDVALKDYPKQILIWAAMNVGEKTSNKKRTQKAIASRIIYSEKDKAAWRTLADTVDPKRENISGTARKIAAHFQLPSNAIETIRKIIA